MARSKPLKPTKSSPRSPRVATSPKAKARTAVKVKKVKETGATTTSPMKKKKAAMSLNGVKNKTKSRRSEPLPQTHPFQLSTGILLQSKKTGRKTEPGPGIARYKRRQRDESSSEDESDSDSSDSDTESEDEHGIPVGDGLGDGESESESEDGSEKDDDETLVGVDSDDEGDESEMEFNEDASNISIDPHEINRTLRSLKKCSLVTGPLELSNTTGSYYGDIEPASKALFVEKLGKQSMEGVRVGLEECWREFDMAGKKLESEFDLVFEESQERLKKMLDLTKKLESTSNAIVQNREETKRQLGLVVKEMESKLGALETAFSGKQEEVKKEVAEARKNTKKKK